MRNPGKQSTVSECVILIEDEKYFAHTYTKVVHQTVHKLSPRIQCAGKRKAVYSTLHVIKRWSYKVMDLKHIGLKIR